MAVDVLCINDDDSTEPRSEVVNGVHVVRLPFRRRRTSKLAYVVDYAGFIAGCAVRLAIRSMSHAYDLVHVHNMPDILVMAALVPKAIGARVILDLHDPMPELLMTIFNLDPGAPSVRLLRSLERLSAHIADVVITVNLTCKQLFASRSCSAEKVSIVMNSPDDEIFRFQSPSCGGLEKRDPKKPFVIMFHGSPVERNGLDLAVEALALVRQTVPTAELRIYGSQSKFLVQVMDSVRDKGLAEVVRYLGPRPIEGIVEAIEQCDVGIIPNRRSIFTQINTPTRIFEYLALRKPVIAPRSQGIQDYFAQGSLLFFELGDAADLARAIEHVFYHPAETLEILMRGQEVYLAHTWQQERLGFVKLVEELLAGKRLLPSGLPHQQALARQNVQKTYD
jgi:glycosyltransferase involved in cell wall biosynthesis